jgi:hypothetical protein
VDNTEWHDFVYGHEFTACVCMCMCIYVMIYNGVMTVLPLHNFFKVFTFFHMFTFYTCLYFFLNQYTFLYFLNINLGLMYQPNFLISAQLVMLH